MPIFSQINHIQNTLRPFDDGFSIAFTIADFDFRWYAIFFIIGFFICIIIGCLVAHYRYKISYDLIFWYGVIIVPAGILGARLGSAIIGDLSWTNFFKLNNGGLAIQGGIIFCGIVGLIYFPLMLNNPKYHVRIEVDKQIRICKPSMWIIVDIIFPLILLGQAIGRWGNFFNGEIFGAQVNPNDLQWLKTILPGVFEHMKVVAGTEPLASGLIVGAYYQPLFLYESFINIIVWIVLYWGLPYIKQIRIGVIGGLYFVVYGIIRFIMEPLRFNAYAFTGTYVINGLLLLFGIITIILCQFILPKYRHRQLVYSLWIKHIRMWMIKIGVYFKVEKATRFENIDPHLENFGFLKKPTFTREDSANLYYANR